MNKEKARKYQIFSVIFIYILGTLFHFTYDWSNQNSIVGLFSSINESTWEHLKLIFFPTVLTIIIGHFYFNKKDTNFICSKTLGLLISMAITVSFFYIYTGILGKNIAFIDIISFFIAVIIGEFISYLLIVNKFKCKNWIAIVVLVILTLLFFIFTFKTPKIGLFKDPITDSYGIEKK